MRTPTRTVKSSDSGLLGTLPLEVRHEREHVSMELHAHDFSELVIVRHGSGIHLLPGGEYPIGAGDVFVLHGDQAHGYGNTAALELVNILFRMEQLSLILRDVEALPGYHALFTLEPAQRNRDGFCSRLRLSGEQQHKIGDRLSEWLLEQKAQAAGWQFASVAHFMLVISDLCRFYSQAEDPVAQSLLRLGTVLGHMHRHYAEHITLDDLAAIGSMSRRTLTREFTRVLGISPINYLIHERVSRAQDLLQDSRISIAEAAYRVGFQDSNYFSRMFRAVVGHSPRDARRMTAQQPSLGTQG